jgi:hypothetical protein
MYATLTCDQTFIAIQSGLLGIPILLFLTFAISTLFISLSTCLLFALITAFMYTGFAVGIALFFLVPTLFIASFAASCFFLWALLYISYYNASTRARRQANLAPELATNCMG